MSLAQSRRGARAASRRRTVGITAPTLVASYGPGAASPTATQTASVTVAVGDILILHAGTGNPTWIPGTPTGGSGITWTLKVNHGNVANSTNLYTWASSKITTAQTFTLSVTAAGSGNAGWAWQAHRWSGASGVGASATSGNAGSAPSLAITTTQDNSALEMAIDDWNQVNGATRTYRTTGVGSFTETYYNFGANETLYMGCYANVGAAGSKTAGMTAPTGMQPTMNLLEVLGS